MSKKAIKIAGAGVAGLTAAINLAKTGYEVEVHEKFPNVGGHYKENPQLLPNWFTKEDVIEELERCGTKLIG
jgi:heterodisulfide reductase subunit A-like polyferredoxin